MPDGPAREMGESPREALLARLVEFLLDKELLLILDNCEHLLDACVGVSEMLLSALPGVEDPRDQP